MIEIDKENYAAPQGMGACNKYPFRTMKIGESFSVPVQKYASVNSAKSQAGKRMNRKFTGKIIGDIFRVWRVA